MVRCAFRRKLAALAVCLTLLAPWSAQALPLDGEPLSSAVSRLTEWLTILFGDVGCSMDPGGACGGTNGSQPPAAEDNLDVGCSLDPDGRCRG